MGADIGEGDPCRLLHHVAELSGEDQALVAIHRGRLDEEHIAAGAGDREAGGDTGDRGALDRLLEEALPAECVADRARRRSSIGRSASPAAIRVAVFRRSLPSSRSS